MAVKAVFIDKDGTLVENVPYNVDPELVRLTPSAGEGLRLLASAGYRLVVVSNKSGLARGYFTESQLATAMERLTDLLSAEGVAVDGFYYCPHHPVDVAGRYRGECGCRKPDPGLLLAAAEDLGIDLTTSWMIGDILDDVEAGRRAGCRTVLLRNGGETEWRISPLRTPHCMARNLADAATRVLNSDGIQPSVREYSETVGSVPRWWGDGETTKRHPVDPPNGPSLEGARAGSRER